MKYKISTLYKLFAYTAVALGVTACSDDAIDDSSLVEFGLEEFAVDKDKVVTVESGTGHIVLKLLSNKNCSLYFAEETPWATLTRDNVNGDAHVIVDYEANDDFPRMAKIVVAANETNLADTVYLRQKGVYMPTVALDNAALVINGSTEVDDEVEINTNLDLTAITPDIEYSGDDEGWIEVVTEMAPAAEPMKAPVASRAGEQCKIKLVMAKNNSDLPRTATVNFVYDNGWGEAQTTSLYVTQKSSNDELGKKISIADLKKLAKYSADITIEDFYIISGYVVSSKESKNAGDIIKATPTSADYTSPERTIYLESEDGQQGIMLMTPTVADNVFERYDHVELLVRGAVLHAENDPDRYDLSKITTQMIVGRQAGTASDIPVKEKYISELTDNDMYTYVTLKDCEFPVRMGPLTPLHEGYTLASNINYVVKFPRLVRDIQGSDIYLFTNTTCPYRRDGSILPYGSGKLSGVVVFEYYKGYNYGDGEDEDTHGRIGTYQLRHMAKEDIQMAESMDDSFSALLTEYRYINKKAKAADGITYWYPTYGTNGRFFQTGPYVNGCYSCTTWSYLGMVGSAKGIAPFVNNIGNKGCGVGIILEDGTNYKADNANLNKTGAGEVSGIEIGFENVYWFTANADGGYDPCSWVIEFSTKDINTDQLSMQFSCMQGRAQENQCPIFWQARWSTERDFTDDSKWHHIGDYTVPEWPNYSNFHEWTLPAYKQINMKLPLEMLGQEHVYVRLSPRSIRTSTASRWDAIEIPKPTEPGGSAIEYFAIRYNKK